jgi:hypothetical protein
LDIDRNAEDRNKILDSIGADFGFKLWGKTLNLHSKLSGRTDTASRPWAYPGREWDYDFESAKISLDGTDRYKLSRFATLIVKARLGCLIRPPGKDNQWETALSGAINGKWGRLSLQAKSEDFPEKWSFTLAWRLVY